MPRFALAPVRAMAACLVVAGSVAGCAARAALAASTWRAHSVMFTGPALAVTDLTALARRDVWLAGNRGDGGAVVTRWNGASWHRASGRIFASQTLYGIAASSARDVWAVGETDNYKIAITRWDGFRWRPARVPRLPGHDVLDGVAVVSAGNAWAVGDIGTAKGPLPLIVHWNGRVWSQVRGPGMSGGGLNSVSAISASDIWAVGFTALHGLILHWDGRAWTRVSSPAPGSASSLSGVSATSARDVWAVGTTARSTGGNRTLIMHWNGTAWRRQPGPDIAGGELWSVVAVSANNAWAVGQSFGPKCLVEHWNGTRWAEITSPEPADCTLTRMTASPDGSIWAAGFNVVSFRVVVMRVTPSNG